MIVTDPARFLECFAELQKAPPRPATARAAFLVSPLDFRLAVESARDNAYMDLAASPDPGRALREHAELARRLADDVPVITFPGDPSCPDGVFPNNVFATVPGRLIVGRMRHAGRQREGRRPDIRGFFRDLMAYEILDLSASACVAELTGALVVDRMRGIGFCGLSERCDRAGAEAMHAAFGLNLTFCFLLAPGEYHTNVVLCVLAGRGAIVAPDGFADAAVADAIARAYGPSVVTIDRAQKQAYAGNAIALTPGRVWLGARAAGALHSGQLAILERAGFSVASADLATLECAGGGLRCCVAEIY
ncbi:MAG TPA: arginine deiminase-related protein [Rhodanobacteraceae bacterium]|nr:arginine deiminase-related protein [Rhodanobacteraceae bacterium]